MGSLFFITTVTAVLKYGMYTQRNLLQDLPAGFVLYGDILLVTLQIFLSMVLGGSAMFQDVENRLGIPSGNELHNPLDISSCCPGASLM